MSLFRLYRLSSVIFIKTPSATRLRDLEPRFFIVLICPVVIAAHSHATRYWVCVPLQIVPLRVGGTLRRCLRSMNASVWQGRSNDGPLPAGHKFVGVTLAWTEASYISFPAFRRRPHSRYLSGYMFLLICLTRCKAIQWEFSGLTSVMLRSAVDHNGHMYPHEDIALYNGIHQAT